MRKKLRLQWHRTGKTSSPPTEGANGRNPCIFSVSHLKGKREKNEFEQCTAAEPDAAVDFSASQVEPAAHRTSRGLYL